MRTPVALIIFNRPHLTEQVLEALRQAKPSKLLVIADGPRLDRPDEAEKCAAARAVVDQVDWDCEVLKNYSDTNLGCGLRPASGISWVFENVEEAIILEDDCIPNSTFFTFCEELLEKYRQDERVMVISGTGCNMEGYKLDDSYVFSRYTELWGWATWRRAWQHYDYEMKQWPEVKAKNLLKDVLVEPYLVNKWTKALQYAADNYGADKLACWDFQWQLNCWLQSGLCIIPKVNLVSNIGYGADAVHTNIETPFIAMPSQSITFPLNHPKYVLRNSKIDDYIQEAKDYYPNLFKRVKNKLRQLTKYRGVEKYWKP